MSILNKIFCCFNNSLAYSQNNRSLDKISIFNVSDPDIYHINTIVNESNKSYKAYLNQFSNSTTDLGNLLGSHLSNKISAVDTINNLF
jgi:hypothetical protein